jgi:hypothetical protein
MKRIMLLTLPAFAVIGGSAAQVKAADCSVNVNACISGNQDKPNAVAKCQAAGQRCAKTGCLCWPLQWSNLPSRQMWALGLRGLSDEH